MTEPPTQSAGVSHRTETELYRMVHQTLRHIAQQRMRRERKDHTLQATALVNEAWLRMTGDKTVAWSDRGEFYAAASDAMRRILIDHARRHRAARRGGRHRRTPLSVVDLAADNDAEEILALEEAVTRLEKDEPEVGAVVRLRFYAGLTIDETAAALNISPRHVDRLWAYARARLLRMLSSDA